MSGAPIRLGVKLPSFGPEVAEHGVVAMARRLEVAGFDALWTSDHVVMSRSSGRSRYPYSDDGKPGWDPDCPWYDAIVVMAQAAAVTDRVEIGCAVLVLPQRHPIILAKQLASLDALAGGRVVLGAGAGWYREEFEALGSDFSTRGRRLDEWLMLLRHCWSSSDDPLEGRHYSLPVGIIHEPRPVGALPVLVGGVSDAALRRAGQLGDGWLGLQRATSLDADEVTRCIRRIAEVARAAGRDPDGLRFALRIMGAGGHADHVAAALPGLRGAGIHDIVIDVGWADGGDAEAVHELLRAA
jgi:probable F420-dependent oxidoreductase